MQYALRKALLETSAGEFLGSTESDMQVEPVNYVKFAYRQKQIDCLFLKVFPNV